MSGDPSIQPRLSALAVSGPRRRPRLPSSRLGERKAHDHRSRSQYAALSQSGVSQWHSSVCSPSDDNSRATACSERAPFKPLGRPYAVLNRG